MVGEAFPANLLGAAAFARTFRTPLEPVDSILVVFRPIYSIKKTFNKFGGLYE
jgi:hypothetical protein